MRNTSATINVPAGALAVGTDTLTVNYSGDSYYAAASGSATVSVAAPPPPTFTISGGGTLTFTRGATSGNSATVLVTPSGGFTGSVALTAVMTSSPVGAQDPPTFSFGSTSPVSIAGTNAGTATLTVITTAASSAAMSAPARPGSRWYAASGAALACIVFIWIPRRHRNLRAVFGMAVLLIALGGGMLACGGSGGSSGSGSGNPGTTPGNYTITVTGTSGSTTASGTVNLIVQ